MARSCPPVFPLPQRKALTGVMMQTGVLPIGSASPSPTLAKGVVVVPEPLTSDIITQTVLRIHEGGVPVLNHQDVWRVTPEVMAAMERLLAIINWVRSPAGGWPSDRPVDAEQLLPYVVDEAVEVWNCLEKSWLCPGLPSSHPFAPLQRLLTDRLLLSDAIAQFLWGVARASVETMQLLGGTPVEVFQASREWTPGILRLMAVLTVHTPHLHWTFDLVTAAPPLPELHYDSLVRWSGAEHIYWAEGLLQSFQQQIIQATQPLQNFLEQSVTSDIIAPGQAWQTGSLRLHLGLTFAPHAKKPALSLVPTPVASPEPSPQQWEEYHFTLTPLQVPSPQGMTDTATNGARDTAPQPAPEVALPIPSVVPLVESLEVSGFESSRVETSRTETSRVEMPSLETSSSEALFEDWLVEEVPLPEEEVTAGDVFAIPDLNDPSEPVQDRGNDLGDDLQDDLFAGWDITPLDQLPAADFEIVLDTLPSSVKTAAAPTHHDFVSSNSTKNSTENSTGNSTKNSAEDSTGNSTKNSHDPAQNGTASQSLNSSTLSPSAVEPMTVEAFALEQFALEFPVNEPESPALPIDSSPVEPQSLEPQSLEPYPVEPMPSVFPQVSVVPEGESSWDLDGWRVRWLADGEEFGAGELGGSKLDGQLDSKLGSKFGSEFDGDWLQLPRAYYVKTLLQELGEHTPLTPPGLKKENRLREIVDLACRALKLPDPPPTLLNTGFVMPESTLASLVHRLAWNLIRNSYGLTCLLSGIPAEILQPEWGWEAGVLRLLPILEVQQDDYPDLDLQIDLGTGSPAPLETVLVLPDILVNLDGSDWQKTREPAMQFRAGVLEQVYRLFPELEVLCCPVPVALAQEGQDWHRGTLKLHFELAFQGGA